MRDAETDFAREVLEWRRDPVRFARRALGANELTDAQGRVLEAVRDHRRVAVPSAHSLGKSHVASIAALWNFLSFGPSLTLTIAPTLRQVRDVLWSEIRQRHRDLVRSFGADPGFGEPSSLRWDFGDGEPGWYMLGFSTSPDADDSGAATRLQGFHSRRILVILDEATAIPGPVWNSLDGLLTNAGARVLAISNPTSPSGAFADACKPGSGWHVLRLSAMDHPNIATPERRLSWGPSPEWIAEMRTKWGESSPVYQSRVLGRFPTSSDDSLIALDDVEAALLRHPRRADLAAPPAVGVDVARYGRDETVLVGVRGGSLAAVRRFAGQNLMRTSGETIALARSLGLDEGAAWRVSVDDTGLGGGVTDRLAEQDWNVRATNFGARPSTDANALRFLNRRAELWFGLREWVRDRAAFAGLDEETADALRSDLTAPKYRMHSSGKLALETKDEIRARIGRSCDLGDALALAVDASSRSAFVDDLDELPRRGEVDHRQAAAEAEWEAQDAEDAANEAAARGHPRERELLARESIEHGQIPEAAPW